MININSKQCAVEGCTTQPSFAVEGDPAKYCKTHAEEGMKSVRNKQCAVEGCETRPSYGLEGGPATHCAPHAEEAMVDVVSKRCAVNGCDTIPVFGVEGEHATHCAPHAEEGMINVNAKQCAIDGCTTQPSFGVKKGPATHCAPHAEEGMVDVKSKKCASCGLFIVPKAPHLCAYCNPSKRQKTREIKIKALLEATPDLGTPIHDKPIGGDCGKYRPDFRYDSLTHFVVVEVDEDQHKGYDPECERIRMINIVQAVGMRCVFVRYNPDTFKIDGKTIRVYEKKRHDLLLRTIREWMTSPPTADVVYLYYDAAEVREETLSIGKSSKN